MRAFASARSAHDIDMTESGKNRKFTYEIQRNFSSSCCMSARTASTSTATGCSSTAAGVVVVVLMVGVVSEPCSVEGEIERGG